MSEYERNPLFQARAEEADLAVRVVIRTLMVKWANEDAGLMAAAFDIRLVANPMLAGAIAALAPIAWDCSDPRLGLETITHGFCATAFPHLEELASMRPPGMLITESAKAFAEEISKATIQ